LAISLILILAVSIIVLYFECKDKEKKTFTEQIWNIFGFNFGICTFLCYLCQRKSLFIY